MKNLRIKQKALFKEIKENPCPYCNARLLRRCDPEMFTEIYLNKAFIRYWPVYWSCKKCDKYFEKIKEKESKK